MWKEGYGKCQPRLVNAEMCFQGHIVVKHEREKAVAESFCDFLITCADAPAFAETLYLSRHGLWRLSKLRMQKIEALKKG